MNLRGYLINAFRAVFLCSAGLLLVVMEPCQSHHDWENVPKERRSIPLTEIDEPLESKKGVHRTTSELLRSDMEAFRERIKFNTAIREEVSDNLLVKAKWPYEPGLVKIAGHDWRLNDDNQMASGHGIQRNLYMKSGKESVRVKIFVSRDGVQAARDFFLESAVSNASSGIFWVKGPQTIGTLSVKSSSSGTPDVLWLYKNVCIQVENLVENNADTIEIARWLQSIAEKGLVPLEQATINPKLIPEIENPYPLPQKVVVGKKIVVTMKGGVPKSSALSKPLLEYNAEKMWVSKEQDNFIVEGKIPGRHTLDVIFVDKSSLLFEHRRLEWSFSNKVP
jgi:hypothetical protein